MKQVTQVVLHSVIQSTLQQVLATSSHGEHFYVYCNYKAVFRILSNLYLYILNNLQFYIMTILLIDLNLPMICNQNAKDFTNCIHYNYMYTLLSDVMDDENCPTKLRFSGCFYLKRNYSQVFPTERDYTICRLFMLFHWFLMRLSFNFYLYNIIKNTHYVLQ